MGEKTAISTSLTNAHEITHTANKWRQEREEYLMRPMCAWGPVEIPAPNGCSEPSTCELGLARPPTLQGRPHVSSNYDRCGGSRGSYALASELRAAAIWRQCH